ncbi:Microsomal glutathione S-transferase 3 [Kappamyces sp. JEL0829]|nr:Microsomal glutathione S-transferase 3 [Kappamyces sp. JEL0829]KAJ3359622.1 Microsomal glutathione S-transferase 3 [Kappamyces sp. JEL0680]
MTLTVALTAEHALPLFAGIASCVMVTYLGSKVSGARKKAKVPYPHMYCSPEECEKDKAKHIFNCAQRAHHNTLENFPSFLVLLATSSILYPTYAGALGFTWIVGRIMYANGYISGNPSNRQQGVVQYVGLLGMLGLSVSTILQVAGLV